MKSPLTVYKEVAKEFGITDEKNIPDVAKLGHAREQAQQQQMIINRLIMDIAVTRVALEAAKDEMTKGALRKKENEYTGDLRQLSASVETHIALTKELEDEVGKEA